MTTYSFQGRQFQIDDQDFDLLMLHSWHWRTDPDGKHPYLTGCNNRTLHRTIALRKMKVGSKEYVDHINGDTTDNRRVNLRSVTASESRANSAKKGGCSSQYKGVTWRAKGAGCWQAYIYDNGRNARVLGTFKSEEEAGEAYDLAALAKWGDRARLNFPDNIDIYKERRKKDESYC